jgi:magnesium-protoporphyrin IX monomethyl ester (oxidative) cyclase
MKKIILFNIADTTEPDVHPSLGLGYIKSYVLKEHKENVQIKIFRENILDNILKEEPDLIGISSVTEFYTESIKFAIKLRKLLKNIFIVVGGVHISTLPDSFHKVFDCGVIREGEVTFSKLTNLLLKDKFKKEELKRINGLVFKDDNGRVIKTKERQLIKNLDDIPHVDRKDYNHKNFAHILTSRGCPYNCAFCASSHFWGGKTCSFSFCTICI